MYHLFPIIPLFSFDQQLHMMYHVNGCMGTNEKREILSSQFPMFQGTGFSTGALFSDE